MTIGLERGLRGTSSLVSIRLGLPCCHDKWKVQGNWHNGSLVIDWGNIRPGGVNIGNRTCQHVCPIAAPITHTWVVNHIAGSGTNITYLIVRVETRSLSDVSQLER